MKYSILFFMTLAGIAFFSGCGPATPSEEEIRAVIVGVYCDGDYRLEITDSTYMNRKFVQSPLRTGLMREACDGTYALVQENGSWLIRFDADESPNNGLFKDCQQDMEVWNKAEGYLTGTDPIILKDLLDGKELTKGTCDDL